MFPGTEMFGRQVCNVVGICGRNFRMGEEASDSAVTSVIVMVMAAADGWSDG